MFEAIFDKHVLTHAGDTAGPLAEETHFLIMSAFGCTATQFGTACVYTILE